MKSSTFFSVYPADSLQMLQYKCLYKTKETLLLRLVTFCVETAYTTGY